MRRKLELTAGGILMIVTAATGLTVRTGQGATYHVAPDGNDKHPGAEAKPLGTIQKAANLARAGDTILVRAGVYREAVVMRYSGEPGEPIVLKGYPGERPVIQAGERGVKPSGQGVRLQALAGYRKPIGWITIVGFEIRYCWDGVKFYNAHDIFIRNNHIKENFNQGILGNGNRVLIEGNIISGNGLNPKGAKNQMHGIYGTGTAFTIRNNVIHSNTAYGIQVAAYSYKSDYHAGREYSEARDWLVTNNTLAFQKNRAGMVIWMAGVRNCTVQNNIFYRNAGSGGVLFYSQEGKRHVIRNNILFPPGENLVSTEKEAFAATANLQVDPRFKDLETFDFHLRADSPAIGAGTLDRSPAKDLEGALRPQGNGVDIGAYESSPSEPTP